MRRTLLSLSSCRAGLIWEIPRSPSGPYIFLQNRIGVGRREREGSRRVDSFLGRFQEVGPTLRLRRSSPPSPPSHSKGNGPVSQLGGPTDPVDRRPDRTQIRSEVANWRIPCLQNRTGSSRIILKPIYYSFFLRRGKFHKREIVTVHFG